MGREMLLHNVSFNAFCSGKTEASRVVTKALSFGTPNHRTCRETKAVIATTYVVENSARGPETFWMEMATVEMATVKSKDARHTEMELDFYITSPPWLAITEVKPVQRSNSEASEGIDKTRRSKGHCLLQRNTR